MSIIRSVVAVTAISAILLLQACGKTEAPKASAAVPAAAPTTTAAPAATLSITDKLTAYNKAGPADRLAVIPAALAKVKDEIDKKGKSDSDISAELLPCMNTVNDSVTDADRASQTILDLAAVCLVQMGYKK